MNVTANPRAMAFEEQTCKYISSLSCKKKSVLCFPPCQLISGSLSRRCRESFWSLSIVRFGKVIVNRSGIFISVVLINLAKKIGSGMKHLSLCIRWKWATLTSVIPISESDFTWAVVWGSLMYWYLNDQPLWMLETWDFRLRSFLPDDPTEGYDTNHGMMKSNIDCIL